MAWSTKGLVRLLKATCMAFAPLLSTGEACEGPNPSFAEEYAAADEIVVARIDATWFEDTQMIEHRISYTVLDRFKGKGGKNGTAAAGSAFGVICGGGIYVPGRTYLLFIGGEDRRVSIDVSRILSEDPILRAQQLQPLSDFQNGIGDGLPPLGAYDNGIFATLAGTRCENAGPKGLSNFPFYPTLRNAYANSDLVVRANIVRQEVMPTGDVLISARIVEMFKGEARGIQTFVAPVFGTPEWMASCLVLFNGWQYLIYANAPHNRIDNRHSVGLTPVYMNFFWEHFLTDADRRGLHMLRVLGGT